MFYCLWAWLTLQKFVSLDETWIHHTTLESKQKSGLHPVKKQKIFQQLKSYCVIWDTDGILMVDNLQK